MYDSVVMKYMQVHVRLMAITSSKDICFLNFFSSMCAVRDSRKASSVGQRQFAEGETRTVYARKDSVSVSNYTL